MQKNISFLELACIIKELQTIKDAKVDNIYVNPTQELLLQIHLPNQGKKILRIFPPHFLYLSEFRNDTQEKPSGFCMFLRKYLDNTRIREINQIGSERIVAIVFQTKEQLLTLYLEFFSKGNIILCDEAQKILAAYDQQEWKDRTIKAGLEYNYPKKEFNFFILTKGQFSELLKSSNKENIVKILALDLGLGGLYAEEIILKSGINKNKKQLNDEEIDKIFIEIKHLRSLEIKAALIEEINELVPFDLLTFKEKEKKSFSSFNELLDIELTNVLLMQKKTDIHKKANKKIDDIKKIMEQQQEHISKIQETINENQQKAEYIYTHYQAINNILKEMQKAREKYTWKEIKEKVKGHKLIKSVNEKENQIIIEV